MERVPLDVAWNPETSVKTMDTSRRWITAFGLVLTIGLTGVDRAAANPKKVFEVAKCPPANAASSANRILALSRIMNTAMGRRLDSYYSRALGSQMAVARQLPGMNRFLVIGSNGFLERNAVTSYYEWRRNRNPERFDRNNPRLACWLDRLQPASVQPEIPTTPELPAVVIPTTPTTQTTPTTPVPQVPVPEPGTLIVGMVMAGVGVLAHRRRKNGRLG